MSTMDRSALSVEELEEKRDVGFFLRDARDGDWEGVRGALDCHRKRLEQVAGRMRSVHKRHPHFHMLPTVRQIMMYVEQTFEHIKPRFVGRLGTEKRLDKFIMTLLRAWLQRELRRIDAHVREKISTPYETTPWPIEKRRRWEEALDAALGASIARGIACNYKRDPCS